MLRSANRRRAITVASPLLKRPGQQPALLAVRLLDDVVRLGKSPKQFDLQPRAVAHDFRFKRAVQQIVFAQIEQGARNRLA